MTGVVPRAAYARMMDKVVKPDGEAGCWLFTGSKGNGMHGQVRVKKNGKWTKDWAHRISYEENLGAIPKGKVVRHKCDVGNCVAPHHFVLGSVQQNNYDMHMRQRGANQFGPYTSFVDTTEDFCPF